METEPWVFIWIAGSVAEIAGVNPNGIETPLGNGLSISFINGIPIFINGTRSLPKNPLACTVFDSWFCDNFIKFAKLFFLKSVCQLVMIYVENKSILVMVLVLNILSFSQNQKRKCI